MNIKTVLQVLSLIFLSAFLSFLSSCRNLTDDESYKNEVWRLKEEIKTESLIQKKTDTYISNNGIPENIGHVELYFTTDGDIPFVEVKDFIDFYFGSEVFEVIHEGYFYIISSTIHENAYLVLDFSTGSALYSNFDYFVNNNPYISTAPDVIFNPDIFSRKVLVDIPGDNESFTLNLKDYNIPLKFENNYGFIPPATIFSLISFASYPAFIYNGKDAFFDSQTDYLKSSWSLAMSNKKDSYSRQFADYSYGHLCLSMDLRYGRKDYLWKNTDITNFDSWFTSMGLKDELSSTDIKRAENALGKILLHDIGDLHTGYLHLTPFMGTHNVEKYGEILHDKPEGAGRGVSEQRFINNRNELKKQRKKYCIGSEESCPVNIYIPRQEAAGSDKDFHALFICFDSFYSLQQGWQYRDQWKYTAEEEKKNGIGTKGKDDGLYFYESASSGSFTESTSITSVDNFIEAVIDDAQNPNPTKGYGIRIGNESSNTNETIVITVVANYIIKKLAESNSSRKIEHVITDMSLNTGGEVDCGVFLASWLLGQCESNIVNTKSGARTSISFVADVNFNGKGSPEEPEAGDNIKNLRKYCITSLTSFSCGNQFSSYMKSSDSVKLFGQKSGGGTCSILPVLMPSGTVFTTSSFFQSSKLINGSFVDIDDGIEVDQAISQADFGDLVYDRENFCKEFLNKDSN